MNSNEEAAKEIYRKLFDALSHIESVIALELYAAEKKGREEGYKKGYEDGYADPREA